jgi:hypothetical protein
MYYEIIYVFNVNILTGLLFATTRAPLLDVFEKKNYGMRGGGKVKREKNLRQISHHFTSRKELKAKNQISSQGLDGKIQVERLKKGSKVCVTL